MEGFLGGLAILLDPWVMFMVFLGTVLGIFVGALPGISGSTTIALMLPMTITMGPIPAICFLGAIYCAANFGGSITAIMVNAPGDPSAIRWRKRARRAWRLACPRFLRRLAAYFRSLC